MWPSENTLLYLILGLLPLFFVILLVVRLGILEAMSLRFIGIIFFWVGYHFSPWLAYLHGYYWDSFLLVPEFIDSGLLFSTLCMIAFLIGYSFIMKKHYIRQRRRVPLQLRLPKIKISWLIFLTLVCIVAFVSKVGGIEEVWISSVARGEWQFEQRDTSIKILRILNVLNLPLHVALASMAALYMLPRKALTPQFFFGLSCLLVASLPWCWNFSRGSGFAFVILGFLALRLKGRKGFLILSFSLIFAVYLGSVGLNGRGLYNPGLGNFLTATLQESASQNSASQREPLFLSPESNPIDAMAPWTRKAEAIFWENPTLYEMAPRFFWNLNPLPSEIVPLAKLGVSLSEIMGTWGSVGITTPALAELYYVFGQSGFVFFIILGSIYGWFERLTVIKSSFIVSFCLLLSFVSLPIGLHNSMRSMTRPLLYAFVLYTIAIYLEKRVISRNKALKFNGLKKLNTVV